MLETKSHYAEIVAEVGTPILGGITRCIESNSLVWRHDDTEGRKWQLFDTLTVGFKLSRQAGHTSWLIDQFINSLLEYAIVFLNDGTREEFIAMAKSYMPKAEVNELRVEQLAARSFTSLSLMRYLTKTNDPFPSLNLIVFDDASYNELTTKDSAYYQALITRHRPLITFLVG